MKQPMKEGSFVSKNVPGVGWSCREWVMQGWGGVGHVGWVGHAGLGWVIYGCDGSCRVGLTGVRWVIKGWGGSCRVGLG